MLYENTQYNKYEKYIIKITILYRIVWNLFHGKLLTHTSETIRKI